MRNIVDLSVFKDRTLALKMPDGETLQLRKPTKAMVIEVLKFKDINEESDPKQIVDALDELVMRILNSNEKLKKYTSVELEDLLNVEMKLVIVQAYAEFIQGIQNDPN